MSWNKPNQANGNRLVEKRKGSGLAVKGALAGLIVVLGGAAWLVFSPSGKPVETSTGVKKALIKEAVPAPAKTQEVVVATGKKWPDKPPRGEKLWRHGEGPRSVAVTNGLLVTYPNYPGVKMILPDPANRPPFKNILDNEIASILSIKPGDTVIDVPLPRDFDKKFAENLLDKVVITEDDTPEQAEMKRQVIEARKILVEAVKRGESPREILTEERKNLRRLMTLRDNYQQIVREQLKDGATAQEISDTVTAANKMLEKEGIEHPVVLPYKQALILKKAKAAGEIQE